MKKNTFIIVALAHAMIACSSTNSEKVKYQNTKVIDENRSMNIDTMRCNLSIIKYTEEHLNKLIYDDLNRFLYTFSNDCSKKAEYIEYSNGLLFKVLEKYPEPVLQCLSKEKNLDIDYILAELSSPILDVDCKFIYDKVKASSGNMHVKKEVLKALNKVISLESE